MSFVKGTFLDFFKGWISESLGSCEVKACLISLCMGAVAFIGGGGLLISFILTTFLRFLMTS